MPVPSPRSKILPARGDYVVLAANVGSLLDGEICYAIDQDQYYQNEGGALVSVGATKAQGALADTATQPGDNVSTLTNDAGYITATETYWTEGTNQLYPADAGNDVLIGGTLPSAPNITLNADGSASFDGDVVAGTGSYSTGDNAALHPLGSVSASRTGTNVVWAGYTTGNSVATSAINALGDAQFAGNVLIGGTLPSAPNISLNADGSAEFTEESLHKVVSFGPNQNAPYLIAATTSYDGTTTSAGTYGYQYKYKIDSGGVDRITIDTRLGEVYSMDKEGTIKLGGTSPSAPNISLNADGSASFAGIAQSGSTNLSSTTSTGVNLNPAGQLVIQRTTSSGSNALLWRGYSGDTQTSSITSGGSAEFAGAATFGGDPLSGANDGVLIDGAGTVRASRPAGSQKLWDGYTTGISTPTSVIYADGSATFAGEITLDSPSPSIQLTDNSGTFAIATDTNGSAALTTTIATGAIRLRPNDVDTFRIEPNGNVLIGGTLPSAANISLKADGNINSLGLAAAGRVYADNTAAKAAGLVDGDVYRKSDGTLMIVFT